VSNITEVFLDQVNLLWLPFFDLTITQLSFFDITCWLIELIFIFSWPIFGKGHAYSTLIEEVYCENCDDWVKKESTPILLVDSGTKDEIKERILKDASKLLILPKLESLIDHIQVNISQCQGCHQTNTLDVDYVSYNKDKDEKIENISPVISIGNKLYKSFYEKIPIAEEVVSVNKTKSKDKDKNKYVLISKLVIKAFKLIFTPVKTSGKLSNKFVSVISKEYWVKFNVILYFALLMFITIDQLLPYKSSELIFIGYNEKLVLSKKSSKTSDVPDTSIVYNILTKPSTEQLNLHSLNLDIMPQEPDSGKQIKYHYTRILNFPINIELENHTEYTLNGRYWKFLMLITINFLYCLFFFIHLFQINKPSYYTLNKDEDQYIKYGGVIVLNILNPLVLFLTIFVCTYIS
jgi:hypothetical protein